MEIKFTKEDIKEIRRIARSEIAKVLQRINENLFKETEKDYTEEMENGKRI